MAHRIALVSLCALSLAALGCSESHTSAGDAGTGGDAPWIDFDDARRIDATCACFDGAPPPDVGPPSGSCAPDDARAEICPAAICDGFDDYAWDGERCVRIDCGTCEGSACGTLAHSPEECQARHAGCVPELCRATGGEWLFFAEECLHYRCGQPLPAECLVGMPVCNCGDGRSFEEGVGCIDDPSCPEVDPLPPETLCTSTGGTWMESICCPTRCGQFCAAACDAPACACGPLEIFDGIRGCVPGLECYEREEGETCGFAGTRCGEGLLCCEHCGGAGCAPDSTCERPLCDSDERIDVCGNDLLAP